MRRSMLAVLDLVGGIALRAVGDERPRSKITFGIVTDLKDYGPPRNVMPRDIHAVPVRHHDGSFKDTVHVGREGPAPPLAPGAPGLPGSPNTLRSERS